MNVGVEERHMVEPLAHGDALVYNAEHARRCAYVRMCSWSATGQRLVIIIIICLVPLLILFGRRTNLVA